MREFSDKAFPGMAVALSPERVCELLQEELDRVACGLDIVSARTTDVRYDPGTKCVLLYRFNLWDRARGRSRRQLFAGRVLREDEGPPEPDPAALDSFARLRRRLIPKPLIYLAGPRILLCAFPYDAAMPWLADALEARLIKRRLNLMWARHGIRARKIRTNLLGYTPNMRAAFEYDLVIENKDTGAQEELRVIAKTNAFKKSENIFADQWALWCAASDRIRMPRPVGYFRNPPLTLQTRLPGRPLGAMVDSPDIGEMLRNTAQTLAVLHRLDIPLSVNRPADDQIKSLNRWGDVLVRIRSGLSHRLDALRQGLVGEIETRSHIRGPIHADFHHTNVLVDGTVVHVIDFDEMAYGDPAVDVGRFLASLRIPSLRAFGNITQLDGAREAFLEEYLRLAPDNVRNIRLFEASSLLTSAGSAFRLQRPQWASEVALLLEEAEKTFGLAMRGEAVAGWTPEHPAGELAYEEKLRWAEDPIYMRSVLDRYLRSAYGADIYSCEIVSAKSVNGRKLFRYRLMGLQGEEEWRCTVQGLISKRSGSFTLFQRLTALYEALAGNSEALRVPRPIAYVARLSMPVVKPCSGIALSSLLGAPESLEAAGQAGAALAAFHAGAPVEGAPHNLDRDAATLAERIAKLKSDHPAWTARMLQLLAKARERIDSAPQRTAPSLKGLSPRHLLVDNGSVAVTDVRKVECSHPSSNAGEFLAELALLGIRREKLEDGKQMADRFRASYRAAMGEVAEDVAAFEAFALLRHACTRYQHEPGGEVAAALLDLAEERLSSHA